MRVRFLSVPMIVILLLSGCGSSTPGATGSTNSPAATSAAVAPSSVAPATSSTATDPTVNLPPCPDLQPISGPIVFGYGNNLLAVKESGGDPQQLTKIPDTWWAHEPAWSPDGKTLAFTMERPASDPQLDWLPVGVICAVDRATGKSRVLARGKVETDSFSEAAWTPDGKALLIALHRRQLDDKKQYLGDKTLTVRVDLATGDYQPVLDNAISPQISPDGKQMSYVGIDDATGDTPLMVADVSGKNPHSLLKNNAQVGTIYMPRWSPDGKQFVFTATSGTIPTGKVQPQTSSPLQALFDRLTGVSIAEAHGIPAFLYLINADGTGVRRLSQKGLDDPRGTWSPDGKKIVYASGTYGVTLVDPVTNKEQQLTDQGNYGGISWAK